MKKITILVLGMFALGLDAYVIAGLIPALDTSFQVGISKIGQTVTVFTLCYALSAPIFSTLLSGRPIRQILLIAMAIFTLANAASGLTHSFMGLLIARAFAGIGAGLFSPMAAAAAVSLVSNEKKGRAIGFILGGMSTGTVIGVPLGLLIAQHSNWQYTFWFVTLLGILALIGIYWQFPTFAAKTPPTLNERIKMLTNYKIARTVGISILASISSLGLYTYLSPVVFDSIGVNFITPYLWAWGLGGIVGSFSIGFLIDYTGHPKALMAGILLVMASSMLFLPSLLPYSILCFLPIFLWGASGWSSLAPQQHTLLSIQPEHGAAAVALNSSANYLGSAIGSALGGLAIGFGLLPTNLPYAAGIVALVAAICQLLIVMQKSQASKLSAA
ncbi:MFS transporter [Legionella sp. D16C41]|uniref:MFS transporter n=1 Tax=Legionella sp. D16C41 TaxID=3402688 RepID=UPI003AF625E4